MLEDTLTYRKQAAWVLMLLFPVLSVLYLFGPDNTPFLGTVSNFLIKQNNTSIIGGCFLGFYVFIAFCYKGYDWKDKVVMKISGSSCIGTIIFETTRSLWIDIPGGIGVFNLPKKVSMVLHIICGGIFYISLIVITAYNFTRKDSNPTEKKLLRNKVYIVCAILQVIFFAGQFVCMAFSVKGNYSTTVKICTSLVNALFLITAGFAWFVKGGGIKKLND